MKPKTKKKNPQDATLRNISALKKRVDWLEEVIQWMMSTGITQLTGSFGFPRHPGEKRK